jgi:hypothetical protein
MSNQQSEIDLDWIFLVNNLIQVLKSISDAIIFLINIKSENLSITQRNLIFNIDRLYLIILTLYCKLSIKLRKEIENNKRLFCNILQISDEIIQFEIIFDDDLFNIKKRKEKSKYLSNLEAKVSELSDIIQDNSQTIKVSRFINNIALYENHAIMEEYLMIIQKKFTK